MTACMSLNVNVTSPEAAIDLFRLRTAANGAVIKVFVATNGTLQIRSDFAAHVVQLRRRVGHRLAQRRALRHGRHEHDVGSLPRRRQDRERLGDEHGHHAGSGRIQIGDTAAKTFTVNFDHVGRGPGAG